MASFDFKINNFDLLRLIAALQVVIVHAHEHFNVETGDGFISILSLFPGVPIFFVISGFLISASLERSKSLSSYIINRIVRIFPALWICFFLSNIILYFVFPVDFLSLDFFIWSIAQLTFFQFYNPEFLRGFGVGVLNGSLWTIPIELQFYLFLPFFYFIFKSLRWSSLFFVVIFILSMAVNVFYTSLNAVGNTIFVKLLGVSVFPYLFMFMVGIFLQQNRWIVKRFLYGKVLYWLVVYIALSFSLEKLGFLTKGNYLNPLSAGVLSLLVISFSYSFTNSFKNILRGNDISYGLYVYHMVIINVLIEMAIFDTASAFFFAVLTSIISAFLSWRFVERPALRLKNFRWRELSRKSSTRIY
ncbi:hypothetical protein BM526_16155 [Alteromonas mediterranea]|uniref:Acyltransferase 3 domain-containing protein n=1 Tax=Alteromonas mediterranea TaxID=314275 RepID=A0AAC9JEN0_9ALTE|nr:acyltransferase [Alteromonas mediterranea]APD91160.1 hypothetical protein BM524_15910 [Alteromonas mediterranea]APE03252.1 hypothetical protein BM526_16155 [Alteromonas mediterranea]